MLNAEILIVYLNSNRCSLTETGKALERVYKEPYSKQRVFEMIKRWPINISKIATISDNKSLDK